MHTFDLCPFAPHVQEVISAAGEAYSKVAGSVAEYPWDDGLKRPPLPRPDRGVRSRVDDSSAVTR